MTPSSKVPPERQTDGRRMDRPFIHNFLLFVALTLVLPLLASCGPGSGERNRATQTRIPSGSPLTLFAVTDPHLLARSLTDGGPAFRRFEAAGDGKQLLYGAELMKTLAFEAQKAQPDIVLIGGDLTLNGEAFSHKAFARHLAELEQRGTRVYVIPGNHDIANPWARSFKGDKSFAEDTVTPGRFRRLYSSFGYGEAVSSDKDSLSYLAAPAEDLWLLMLDSSRYRNNKELGRPQLDGELSEGTLAWVRKCGRLAEEAGAELVAVMHHSLLEHNPYISEGFTLNNGTEAAETLLDSGVRLILTGHIHLQDIASYGGGTRTMTDIAGSALSVYPHQFGKLVFDPDRRELVYDTARLRVETWAAGGGSQDINLLEYGRYGAEAAQNQAIVKAYNRLAGQEGYGAYTQDELWTMARFMARLNESYLTGTDGAERLQMAGEEGYRLWSEAPPDFARRYILDLAERPAKENRHAVISLPEREAR